MQFRTIILGVLLAVFVSGCALFDDLNTATPDWQIGEIQAISGELIDTIDDCAFDGICALILASDQGEIAAIWTNGMMRCQGQFASEIANGQRVEVQGEVVDPVDGRAALTICNDSAHYIRIP